MSIWRKILGLPLDPAIPEPDSGFLHKLDDEGMLYAHKIVAAGYNIYTEGGREWLTIRIESEEAHLPPEEPDTVVSVELNMIVEGMSEPVMFQSATLLIPAYSEDLGNLTSMYYFTHSNFEGAKVEIEEVVSSGLMARISGQKDYDPVVMRCCLSHDPSLKRSFT